VVDQTGVGHAVVEVLRQATGWVIPLTLTAGHALTLAADGSYQVPKADLVSCLQLLLEGRPLHVARGLAERDTPGPEAVPLVLGRRLPWWADGPGWGRVW
jgi:hypothetical protein